MTKYHTSKLSNENVCKKSSSSVNIWDDYLTCVDDRDSESVSANSIRIIPVSENTFQKDKNTVWNQKLLKAEEFKFAKSLDCDNVHVSWLSDVPVIKNPKSSKSMFKIGLEDKKKEWLELKHLPSNEIMMRLSQTHN